VLTPFGRGAIATIAVWGTGAIELVARRFRPANRKELTAIPIGRVVFGRFEMSPTTAEELVVGLIAPDEVEIHCHGGKAAVEAICEALVDQGGMLVTPEEWAAQQMADPLAAQAILALAEARTERSSAILLDQYRGALRNELTAIEQALAQGDRDIATRALDALLARSHLGLHLCQPWKVVIAGRPNAGKSSLMNAILGYQRSIVWHEPGTTRDVLTATTAIDGWPLELIDTAGLRTTGEAIEAEGVNRAERQIAAADLVVWVADATANCDSGFYRSPPTTLVVHNKIDLARPSLDGRPAGIETSALTGEGIAILCQAIVQTLLPNPPHPGAAVPFTSQQVAALQITADALAAGEIAAALAYLRSFPDYNHLP
jgi:tRNA modification GTPase